MFLSLTDINELVSTLPTKYFWLNKIAVTNSCRNTKISTDLRDAKRPKTRWLALVTVVLWKIAAHKRCRLTLQLLWSQCQSLAILAVAFSRLTPWLASISRTPTWTSSFSSGWCETPFFRPNELSQQPSTTTVSTSPEHPISDVKRADSSVMDVNVGLFYRSLLLRVCHVAPTRSRGLL